MVYLRSIGLRSTNDLEEIFPFTLPVIRNLKQIEFQSQVTFFVGENGSGKSTLLEAIASAVRAVAVGSEDIRSDQTLAHARKLGDHLKLVHTRKASRGFFFRAEDIFGFTKRIIKTKEELQEMEAEFSKTLTGAGRTLAMGAARGQRLALTGKYGADPDAKSHGESFLDLFESRVVRGGLYLLDEPETPLSPLRQLTLLSMLKEMVLQSCQFIIATHSPILMAFPEATILSFDHAPVRRIEYEQVEHVSLTKAFLNDPEAFIRRL